MAVIAWFLIIALGVLSIAAFSQRYAQFGVFFGGTALVAATATLVHFGALTVLVLCILWTIALVATVLLKANADFWLTLGILILSAFLLLLTPLGNATASHDKDPSPAATQNMGGDKAKDTASAGTGTAPKKCDDPFVQKWDPNTDYRLASAGLWDDASKHTITAEGAAQRQKALAGHDARYLASSAWSINLWDDPNNVAPLMSPDKTCLSTQGIALYNTLVKTWDSAKAEITKAPATGVNTGSNDGKFVANANAGITGDRTSIKRTYPGGKVSYDLARCGNHVLPSKPHGVPPGKTNVPPKETPKPPTSTTTPPVTTPPSSTPPTTTPPTTTPPTTTPPTTTPPTTTPPTTTPPTTTPPTTTPPTTKPPTCPPGQTGTPPDCLETKGPVPYPTDKPSDNKTQGPPETKAPVETHPADPTDKPGDEATDAPAPGATQGPTHEVTQPPATGAPTGDDKGTGIPDPDQSSTPANSMALFPFGGGLLAWWLRRRRDKVA